jgi:hypothetical protein
VDPARAGDDTVAGCALVRHVEVVALMDNELVELQERSGVEQDVEPLAGGLLAGLVLATDPLLAAGQLGLRVTAMELIEAILM